MKLSITKTEDWFKHQTIYSADVRIYSKHMVCMEALQTFYCDEIEQQIKEVLKKSIIQTILPDDFNRDLDRLLYDFVSEPNIDMPTVVLTIKKFLTKKLDSIIDEVEIV